LLREERIDAKFGRLAGVVKFLSDDPQSTKAWASGASGEMRVAKELADALGTKAILLDDAECPGRKETSTTSPSRNRACG
jgi:hypothetical protein